MTVRQENAVFAAYMQGPVMPVVVIVSSNTCTDLLLMLQDASQPHGRTVELTVDHAALPIAGPISLGQELLA
jgi:hypothetical protein